MGEKITFNCKIHPSLDIVNEPVRPLLFTISSHSLYQGIVKNKIFKFLLYTFSIHFYKSLIQWNPLYSEQIPAPFIGFYRNTLPWYSERLDIVNKRGLTGSFTISRLGCNFFFVINPTKFSDMIWWCSAYIIINYHTNSYWCCNDLWSATYLCCKLQYFKYIVKLSRKK